LKLARNLLQEEGVIFISIDDGEVANLRRMCDEIYGEENFIAQVVWSRKRGKDNSAKFMSRNHEYLVIYARSITECSFGRLEMPDGTRKAYTNPDNDPRGDYRLLGVWARGSQGGSNYEYVSKNGETFTARDWLVGKSKMTDLDTEKKLRFNGDKVYRKLFLTEYKGDIPETIWLDASNAANAADEIKSLFLTQVFDTVKPIPYLIKMLKCGGHCNDSLILDFFSGSATTAHAVMQLNAEDGGKRRHIMVQLPEPCDEKSEAFKAGYKTIAEIGKERIRRAGAKIKAENATTAPNLDIGFRVLKIDSSNMKDVYYAPDAVKQGDLMAHSDNIKEGRTAEDLLFQVLVDWGVDLTRPIFRERMKDELGMMKGGGAGREFEVFFVDGNALAACFEPDITEELVREIAMRKPMRAVFRDSSFGSDSAKINVEQVFKLLSPGTELRTL
jgi:adenine-specific DNA-methyltransferase